MFTNGGVYWGTDVPEQPGALYRWDRSSGEITAVLRNVREPYFDARQSRGWLVQFSEISTAENDGYIGDEHVHALLGNRARWRRITTPWVRRPDNKHSKVAPMGLTQPDSNGCFWLSLPNVVGADGVKNLEVCLGRR